MIGLRTLKTAIAVSIVIFIYSIFIPDNIYFGPFYGGIAAAISMQPTTKKTKHIAVNRVIGTLIGGIYSAIFFSLYLMLDVFVLEFAFVFMGIIFTIVTCNKFGFSAGISTGCIVMIGAFTLDFPTSPLLHAFTRTVDTSVGVIIAYWVNYLLPGGE